MVYRPPYKAVAKYKTPGDFQNKLTELGSDIEVDPEILSTTDGSPLAQSINFGDFEIGNRWCIHPMEGWDANKDGSPTPDVLQRIKKQGRSGAKLLWGLEAAAVRPDGRANENQTHATENNRAGLRTIRQTAEDEHGKVYGETVDLLIGLQLTDSGRFRKPTNQRFKPKVAYDHPLLREKFERISEPQVIWTDEELDDLVDDYVTAARVAKEEGYGFVDVKACHGYLLHEFLSARSRTGKYGGSSLEARTNLMRTIIKRINSDVGIPVACRLSLFDSVPFVADQTNNNVGKPMDYSEYLPYKFGFGLNPDNPNEIDLTEPFELIAMLVDLGVFGINFSCASPYYNPHKMRPAMFPPSDGYYTPEEPLVGVDRQIQTVRTVQERFPDLLTVGTGYTYLQDYLPHVAQTVVRKNWVKMVGIGRMVLSNPTLPGDTLAGNPVKKKKTCRTFSDCTTAPRKGLISGCYPLDDYYKGKAEAKELKEIKAKLFK